ncbi:IclR family transcriptional regulator [Haloferax sp. ATB1]|uniref:IclR family transcriptional regulator n=1 Tax=Haloferax sp. ATB1 TaxID=1508454 RepID=UPI0005B1FE56|nr:IclR family transcriptional regulator [Haloferax sp. ATB1]
MAGNRDEGGSKNRINSIERAFNIVDFLEGERGATVTETATALDTPQSTVHIYLKTLESLNLVVRDGDSYRLGFRFLKYGGGVRNRSRLYRTAKLEVDKLARETGEVANLGIEENGLRVLLYKSEEADAIHDNAPIGEYTNMHWTALGKAMLAHYPPERVEEIIDQHGLPEANEHTITTREELYEELEETRDRGYSIEDQDRRQGVLTIGVPIMDQRTNEVISAVSVSGPVSRVRSPETMAELADAVKSTANVIELRYAHY